MSLLECKNIVKKFDNRTVLDNVSLKLSKGKIIGLLGKNGVGKTTLIKIINGLLTTDNGEILFNNHDISYKDRNDIAYLPERSYLNKDMKIYESINYMRDFYSNFDENKAYKLLEELNLDKNITISKLSKGMQEKLRLILVMARNADLYILDEPLGGVDPATRDYILDTILTNIKSGSSVLISTHLISDVERILDEVIFIDEGKIKLVSDTDELRKKENASIDEIFRRTFKC